MAKNEAAILIMKAAGDLRKAAASDKKRCAELQSVADYLESIIYEAELGYGKPLFPEPEPAPPTPEDEIRRMMKPFRVRPTPVRRTSGVGTRVACDPCRIAHRRARPPAA